MAMNMTDLTPQQLRRAASIKEKLDALNRELRSLFIIGVSASDGRVVIQWIGIGKEAHNERGGEKENRGGAAREMGKNEARLNYQPQLFRSLIWPMMTLGLTLQCGLRYHK